MNKQRLEYLFQKYFDKTASQSEREELFQHLSVAPDEEISSLMKNVYDTDKNETVSSLPDKGEEVLNAVFAKTNTNRIDSFSAKSIKRGRSWFKYASIAALLLISFTLGIFSYKVNFKTSDSSQKELTDIIEPGGNKAVLILANGATIDLDNVSNGEIANEMGVRISKTTDGHLVYDLSKSSDSQNIQLAYNTIKTPRGGQYQIVLPDGSKVWLNAESSLKYPTIFAEERRVELKGEGYFEIMRDENSPFIVSTDRQDVTVLGTHFNINSYKENQVIKTTLLEGSVKISNSHAKKHDATFSKILKPGEQAVVNQDAIKVSKVNVSNAIAWKNGLFRFENTNIKEVMEEFSRWYDVEVEFEGTIPDIKLWGSVYRNVSASEALDILGYFNLKYRIKNDSQDNQQKKIIISQI